MSSKRSSSSRRAAEFPVSGFDPEIANPLVADYVLSLQSGRHGPASTTPPLVQPLSPLRGPRRTSYPRDRPETVDLRGGFDLHIVNASAANMAPPFDPAQRMPLSMQPPSAPLRPRSVSRRRRRDHAVDLKGRGLFDQHVEIPLEGIMAPPEDEPQTPPPRSAPSSPPRRRHVKRTSKRSLRTTMEDAHENDLAGGTLEPVTDNLEAPRHLVDGEGSSRFSGSRTPPKPVPKENPTPIATPYSMKIASQVDARVPQDAEKRYHRYAAEAEKYIIGPMPVEEFLKFLPDADGLPECDGAFDIVNTRARETDMYHLLIQAIEDGGFCPSVKFVNTSTVGGDRGYGELKPDISGFDVLEMSKVRLVENDKSNMQEERYEANVGLNEIFGEIKGKIDPFCDDPKKHFLAWLNPPVRPDKKSEDGFVGTKANEKKQNDCGQIICYAVEQCSRQHRAFLFSAMFIGTRARLFRFDRAGIIVTKAFDYVEDPMPLCEFLWRFHHATPAQRGYDPSVSVASKAEERLFKDNIAKEVAFQLDLDPVKDRKKLDIAMKRHYEPGKVTKVKVFNDLGDRSEFIDCLVSVPVASPRSLNGRCTRGYWAVIVTGPKKESVVFLKDIWRIVASKVEIEGAVYDEMMEAEVENISNKFYGGDVLYEEIGVDNISTGYGLAQATQSQDFVGESWINKSLTYNKYKDKDDLNTRVFNHTHYRMVLEDVGYPLNEFTGSQELFEAVRDAVNALVSAYKKCKRLHRDVSIGNIILVRCRKTGRRKGILIDWEFSVRANREGRSTDYIRSGTWAFMSFTALQAPSGYPHTLELDLESALYVIMFASILFLRHSHKVGLGQWLHKFFDDHTSIDGQYVGGDWKMMYAQRNGRFRNEFEFDTSPINEFFSRMYADLQTFLFHDLGIVAQTTWTAENVQKHFKDVCDALAHTPGTERDRFKNDTSDYYADIPPEPKATHMSNRVSSTNGSDAVPNLPTNDPNGDSNRRGSKRTLRHDEPIAGNASGTTSDTKRTRIVGIDGKSMAIASSSVPPRLSTLNLEERTSSRRSHARVYGSRTSHRISRQSSKSSQRKLLRKDSDLSSKSSKSGSRHPRKPRSDSSRASG